MKNYKKHMCAKKPGPEVIWILWNKVIHNLVSLSLVQFCSLFVVWQKQEKIERSRKACMLCSGKGWVETEKCKKRKKNSLAVIVSISFLSFCVSSSTSTYYLCLAYIKSCTRETERERKVKLALKQQHWSQDKNGKKNKSKKGVRDTLLPLL